MISTWAFASAHLVVVEVPGDHLRFELRIYRNGARFQGLVSRLDTFRLQPSFGTASEADATVAVIDDFDLGHALEAGSEAEIVAMLERRLVRYFPV